eukprot:162129_1
MELVRKYSTNINYNKIVEQFSVAKINRFGKTQNIQLKLTVKGIQNVEENVVINIELWKDIKTSFVTSVNTLMVVLYNGGKRQYQSKDANIIHESIQKRLNSKISILYLRTFLDFLYRQFIVLAGSTILINPDIAVDVAGKFRKKKFIEYHKCIASSFAIIAKHFACLKYEPEIENDEKYNILERIDEGFSMVNEFLNADPPIVFINAPFLTHITLPNLTYDLSFQLTNSSNSYTLLCNNLDKCKHSEAEEWKLVQKIMQSAKITEWGLYNFEKKVEKYQVKDQKLKLTLILKVCGGFRRINKTTKQIQPILDENEREQFVDALYSKHKHYVLTFDNIVKIVSIFFRINTGIPLLIIGETGCGKTALLKYMTDILQLDMIIVDVNGGYNNDNLQHDIYTSKQIATHNPNRTILLFFDKINTSKIIPSFKEIFCDNCFKGQTLPANLIVIGTLNPYRKRKQSELKLVKQKNEFESQKSKLVYTVYTLPPSMRFFVWNFEYPINDEMEYITGICNYYWTDLIPHDVDSNSITVNYQSHFASLIHKSQQKMREWYNEISICSLRDVDRASKFFVYFYRTKNNAKNRILKAIIMAIAQVYYYRLPGQYRTKYEIFVTNELELIEKKYFINTINKEHNEIVSMLAIPKGVAANKTFKENIFIMLTCIITCTPAFVIGPPGSSKTLAMLT